MVTHIAIDYVTDLPSSQGHTTILTAIDRFSKACRRIPLPTALETAEVLCNYVFRFYSLPENVVSDWGPQFTSHVWSAFCCQLNINVSLHSGYYSQANGQVERLNQELTRFLRSYCHKNQSLSAMGRVCPKFTPQAIYRYHSLPMHPRLPTPLFPWSGEPSDLPAVNSWLQHSEGTWNDVHVHLQRAVRRTRKQANRHRRPNPNYQPVQWVWLSTWDLRLRLPCKKLNPRYVGPFKIIRQITPVSFRLTLPYLTHLSCLFAQARWWSERSGGPRRGWWPEGPSHRRWRSGGLPGPRTPGLSSSGQIPPVSRGLGGVRSGGTVMGQCWWYPRPFTYHWLP